MSMQRRSFIALAASLAAVSTLGVAGNSPAIRAIAFDGFVIFDPRPVAALAERLFPGKGGALMAAWRTRQFEYTWLRNSMKRYADFATVTEQALVFACRAEKIALGAEQRSALLQAFQAMSAWPDVRQALQQIRGAGIRVALLANLTPSMMADGIAASGLDSLFDAVLSTDRAGVFKPDPRAYQLGVDAFGLPKDAIAFAAFGGWDAVGAAAFGYNTIWINRANAPAEEFDTPHYAQGRGMQDVLAFLGLAVPAAA